MKEEDVLEEEEPMEGGEAEDEGDDSAEREDGSWEGGDSSDSGDGAGGEIEIEDFSAEDDEDDAERESGGEEGDDDEVESPGDGESAAKKGFFKKKKDKRDEQIEDLSDRLRRQMAEFDNFRKRSEREKAQMYDMGARSVIEKFLPIVDNFERGLAAVPEDARDDPFVDGIDKVYKQMLTELENMGVTAIPAVGEPFDPELHNAVMQVESEEYESGTVAQELQKGYKYKDSVVRHSMVAVVQ